MVIDIRRDKLVPEAEAYREVMPDPPSPAQRWRWRVQGVLVRQPDGSSRRVKLDAVRVGRQVYSTPEAVRRFIELTNPQRSVESDPDADRERAEETDGRLKAAGLL